MAGYRQFHTQFWKDEWVIELDPLKKYLFTYLFTNELSSISGLYKLPIKVIINETGLEKDFILSALKEFQEAKKIAYADNVLWVVNMRKFHENASPHTMKKVTNDINDIPDCAVKKAYQYYQETGIYSIDTVSIQNSESVSVIKSLSVSESVRDSASKDANPQPAVKKSKPSKEEPDKDPRIEHPAMIAIRTVTKRYPPKPSWDLIIGELGDHPDTDKLQQVYAVWTASGYNPGNYQGVIEWYKFGIPAKLNGNKQNVNKNQVIAENIFGQELAEAEAIENGNVI